jgi:adenosylhomocysteine nucleosidase
MVMPKVAMVAALEREVSGLTRNCARVEQEFQGRSFVFLECDELVIVCGGIGMDAARRAAEAVIALYSPERLLSVGFAGALETVLRVGEVFEPAAVVDARDGSRVEISGGDRKGILVSFMAVAGVEQKASLARAYGAQAVDMEAAAVASAARSHDIGFSAIKVISDESTFEIPGMETARFIDARGQFRTASFAAFVAFRPWLWRRVAVLAGNSRKAATALVRHLERFRQGLSQASDRAPEKIDASPQPAANGLRANGRE